MQASSRSILVRARSFAAERLRFMAFWLFERILQPRNNYWAFCTWHGSYPHTMDNPRGVFEEVKNDPGIVKVILRKKSHDASLAVIEGINVVSVNVESLRGAYYLARCRFVLIGYGLAGLCSYSHLIRTHHRIIQLWHGIPLKRIGRLFSGEPHWQFETPRYAATVCSSPSDQKIMAAAFAPVPHDSVWMAGLPRNDILLKEESSLPADYRGQLQRLRRQLDGRRFVLYAPTWRAADKGIYAFSDADLAAIRSLCRKHNAALGIRAHANRRIDEDAGGAKDHSIFFVNDYPDVNVLLRVTDVLITDYSSIYIDFLLTGRPILPFTYDIDSYVNERGFLYDLEEALPAAWFRSADELVTRLDAALSGAGLQSDRYESAKRLFHVHGDRPSADVANRIRMLMSGN